MSTPSTRDQRGILRYCTGMTRITQLGVPIDAVSAVEAKNRILQLLAHGGQHHVVTPNAEMLVEAARSEAFRRVLQRSALNLPDGVGLKLIGALLWQRIPERVTGVDIVECICRELGEDVPVFLLGGGENVARRTLHVLKKWNPRLHVVGTYAGSPRDEEAGEVIRRINEAHPYLLLVAYGAPHQDLWIAKHLHRMPSVRVAMGVGGTFDFIAGVQRRAPRFVQRIGLEWLWRVIREPRRIKRIWNAVVVYPWLVLRYGEKEPV